MIADDIESSDNEPEINIETNKKEDVQYHNLLLKPHRLCRCGFLILNTYTQALLIWT